ncbi:hypothetical protein QBC40DRAFT_295088 [Triangularia verruculosa]|uniref:Uncharacterized protein n=1 Tax=Triangularia verruculosa TaxID=2587418 RepID=A0AAN7AWG4_9PEZI|nr:hypothetical protein QBC40DRAFT_295088 [Triangularia verruculosa]
MESPDSVARAAKRQKLDDINVIWDMSTEVRTKPASQWDPRHLIAYRLRVGRKSPFLPTFLDIHHNSCPVCGGQNTPPQRVDIGRVRSLIGETPRNLCQQAESELLRLPEGFFWAALARAARHESAQPVAEKVYPQRARTSVQWEGYIPSRTAIPGSSSPTLPSSSDFGNDTDDFDEDENEARRVKMGSCAVTCEVLMISATKAAPARPLPKVTMSRHSIKRRSTTKPGSRISKGISTNFVDERANSMTTLVTKSSTVPDDHNDALLTDWSNDFRDAEDKQTLSTVSKALSTVSKALST